MEVGLLLRLKALYCKSSMAIRVAECFIVHVETEPRGQIGSAHLRLLALIQVPEQSKPFPWDFNRALSW